MVDGGLWPATRPSHVGCERAEVVVGRCQWVAKEVAGCVLWVVASDACERVWLARCQWVAKEAAGCVLWVVTRPSRPRVEVVGGRVPVGGEGGGGLCIVAGDAALSCEGGGGRWPVVDGGLCLVTRPSRWVREGGGGEVHGAPPGPKEPSALIWRAGGGVEIGVGVRWYTPTPVI
jgi:hypothetical protein